MAEFLDGGAEGGAREEPRAQLILPEGVGEGREAGEARLLDLVAHFLGDHVLGQQGVQTLGSVTWRPHLGGVLGMVGGTKTSGAAP